ncbi:MAG: integrase arm-type DNA-binding domain-containing protein [Gammaproteobacteria bacterium]|nr:integrase arm-type DNA-binding domain-containing protein [Gammaproteobacteria bacterium]
MASVWLADARDLARQCRRRIREGKDPIAERRAKAAALVTTNN